MLTSRAQRARSAVLYLQVELKEREALSCILLRSAKRDHQRSGKRIARVSESSTCFPCWKSNQVTLFWRELFRVRSRRKVSIITFPVSYNGLKAMSLFFSLTRRRKSRKPSLFFMFLQFQKIFPYNVVGLQRTLPNKEGYFQDRLNYFKPKHVKIRSFYLAICSKWERNCLTKLCRTQRNANQELNF